VTGSGAGSPKELERPASVDLCFVQPGLPPAEEKFSVWYQLGEVCLEENVAT